MGCAPASPDEPDLRLDRIPLQKFTSIRRTMSEAMGPVEHLIAKGPISKYATGEPAVRQGPIPELLKNYMDVSVGPGEAAWGWGNGLTAHSAAGRSWLSGNVPEPVWVLVKSSVLSLQWFASVSRVGGRASTQTPL